MEFYKFDTKKYNFRDIIEDYLGTIKLEDIYNPKLKFENASDCLNTEYHNLYAYKVNTDPKLIILYRKFIKEYVSKIFDFEILFERRPLIRIHQKNNISTFDYHIDSNYLTPNGVYDIYKHEINFWMPLTKAYETNSLWIESCHNKKDYSPINACYGELVKFDGANLYHGTEINKTGQTRVSLDFRVISKKIFKENQKVLSDKTKNILCNYYDEIKLNYFNYY
jgi:hypothetical protein